MKVSTLLLTAVIALGAGVSGSALAHGDYNRDHDRYNDRRDHGRHEVYRKGHGHRHYRPLKRHWKHRHRRYGHSYWRPPVHHDSSYGIHLFLSGH